MSEEIEDVQKYIESKVDYYEESTPSKSPVKKEIPFDLYTEQERTKAWLAKGLLIIFGSTIGAFFFFIGVEIIFPNAVNSENVKDLLTLVLTSEVGIIGTSLGFYFGNQSKS